MSKGIRFYAAHVCGKMTYIGLKMLKRNGTYLPGRVADKICHDYLAKAEKPETVVCVTGTNGKTTVCNMLNDILIGAGYEVMNNRAGSNTDSGIRTALMSYSSITGKMRKKIAILEIDERTSKLIYPYVKPDYLVCTNLFRDSITRNAHPEYISGIITSALPDTTKMILNADDPISSRLKEDNERVYFALGRLPQDKDRCENIINDLQICPKCSTKLKYEFNRYHHIGKVYCPNYDYKSPDAKYAANADIANMTMTMEISGKAESFPLITNSVFNIYNQVTVVAVLSELGLTPEQIREGFKKLSIVETRYSTAKADGLEVITHMAKGHNPIACSCVFDYAVSEPGIKEVILMPDDDINHMKTSENITWAYDCDFEKLAVPEVVRVVVGGIRAEDYRLRLLLAGVPADRIYTVVDEADAYRKLILKGTDKVFILHQLYKTEAARIAKENIVREVAKNGR